MNTYVDEVLVNGSILFEIILFMVEIFMLKIIDRYETGLQSPVTGDSIVLRLLLLTCPLISLIFCTFRFSDGVIAIAFGASMYYPIVIPERKTVQHVKKQHQSFFKVILKVIGIWFSGCSDNFCLATRTNRPDWIGSCHLSQGLFSYLTV